MKKNIVIIVVIIMIGGVWLIKSRSNSPTNESTNTNTNSVSVAPAYDQAIVLSDFAFTPKEFTVTSSQTIKVLLQNEGESIHTFTFDALDFGSGGIDPGKSTTATFTVPTKPGRYSFHSAAANDRAKGMVGTLLVQ